MLSNGDKCVVEVLGESEIGTYVGRDPQLRGNHIVCVNNLMLSVHGDYLFDGPRTFEDIAREGVEDYRDWLGSGESPDDCAAMLHALLVAAMNEAVWWY